MGYEIIDFHTHPFRYPINNICEHLNRCDMSVERTKRMFENSGTVKFCGSVISNVGEPDIKWEQIKALNDEALALTEIYGDMYIPGFHVHLAYTDESLAEIERMSGLGVKIVGELVPYMHGWLPEDLLSDGFSAILESAAAHGMIVSLHTCGDDYMDKMVRCHPDTVFVAAHPGESAQFERHLARMKMSDNYYLDISGTGILRYGLLRHGIDECGKEKFLFGSDFPICNPFAYIGCVANDDQLMEEEKRAIFSENAKRLLKL